MASAPSCWISLHPIVARSSTPLLAWADICIVGLKLNDVERFGLDWERARTINPGLVQLILTPFGPEGPDADVGGYDVLVQGRSGVGFSMNRSSGGVPEPTRPAINDTSTGIMATVGILAALRHRDLTGEGQRVDVSLLGTAMALGTPMLTKVAERDTAALAEIDEDLSLLRAAGADFDAQRELYEQRAVPAGGAFRLYFRHYRTADGFVTIGGLSPGLMGRFHEITGVADARGVSPRSSEFEQIVTEAEAIMASKTTAEWLAIFRAAKYPAGPYNLPHEALEDPQVRANNYAVDIEHPSFGTYTTTANPVRLSRSPLVEMTPSPRLGEHTAEVLAELGLAD
ncbi:MAG: CoA transferase [Acidimicrobiales bacterium]